jgi:hypothetical protein
MDASDIDDAILQRLAQHLQGIPTEFWQFIQEQHAMMSQAHLARPGNGSTAPEGCRRNRMMIRSKLGPALRRSAGARLTVTLLSYGVKKPEFLIAARTRSLLSLTAASGNPTMDIEGIPLLTSTST